MSSQTLPPLLLFPERPERPDDLGERLESLCSGPAGLWSKWLDFRAHKFIAAVNAQAEALEAASSELLRQKIRATRDALRIRGLVDDLTSTSFALIREVSRRETGLRHFDVQLNGGYALLRGMVAEMDTGEGKTLTATLAAATAALAGTPVHVVTVNDYLARRDAQIMTPLYSAMGLTVGTIYHGLQPAERREAYACDITYASNKEIAFDYLRDRLAMGQRAKNLTLKLSRLQGRATHRGDVVMRGLHFAIVDEADSVLVDEARTPLIISRQTDASTEKAWAEQALHLASQLNEPDEFRVLREDRRIELRIQGCRKLAEAGEELGGIWRSRVRREESVRQALTAMHLFQEGEHYIVREGKVEIVDEYTGRILADRSWSEGLHQLVEVKESCEVTSRKVPVARMTYQRFFRRYRKLAGMTGTVSEVASEMWKVYRLLIARIPTNRPSQRTAYPTVICASKEEKWLRIIDRTRDLYEQGRPVLIGTRSVKASEEISEKLTEAAIEHIVLNAKQDADEAEIIASAGLGGRVTVATNMAGRGVDITLGEGIADLGGLHVILSELHDARRIDRQLQGRCGRQGEPGSTEAILSLEDSLLDFVKNSILLRLARGNSGIGRYCAGLVFRRAQARAERAHARVRHELLKHDRKLGRLLAFSGGME